MKLVSAGISPKELSDLLRINPPKVKLVDVRERYEHAAVRIKGGVLLPMSTFSEQALAKHGITKQEPFVLYCRSGRRSEQVCYDLRALGYAKARSLEGGIMAWKNAGLPVEQ